VWRRRDGPSPSPSASDELLAMQEHMARRDDHASFQR
jgi:hypothetical protein